MTEAEARGVGSRPPLSGFRVGIAAHRASREQVDALRHTGGEPLPGAVVGPVPSAALEALEAVTEDLLIRPASVVVLTSGAGVEGWWAAAEGAERDAALRDALSGATVLADDDETAQVASALGLEVAATLSLGGVDARTQLMRLSGGLTGARVAVQGEASRPPGAEVARLVFELRAGGIEVVEVAVPLPAPAEDLRAAMRLVDAVVARRLDALTFTDPAEVRSFVALATGAGSWDEARAALESDVIVACMGRTCAVAARSVGLTEVIQPGRARVGALIEVLEKRLTAGVISLRLGGVDVVLRGTLALVGGQAGAEEVWLGDRERGLLLALARRPGTVVAKAELLRRVWRSDGVDGADEHAVEVAVARLRRRLGAAGAGLQTVPRRGYRLVAG